MRELSDTLLATQKAAPPINALAKLILTYGEDSYTYDKSQIIDIKETGDGPLQSFTVILNNGDKTLTDIDLQGYDGILSYGANKEYSDCPPVKVISQEFDSTPNKLTCTLNLVGPCNLMSEDKASEPYMPDEDDTKTVKTLVNEIAGASLGCFSHCQTYEVVWEEGYHNLADSYKPRDSFRIYVNGNRLSAINRLLDNTKNVMIPKADGKLHIFQPTTSGESYSYTYSLLKPEHTFFAKSLRNRLVIPSRIVVQSYPGNDPFYQGEATDAESYAKLPKTEYHQMRLESNDQAEDIAKALLAKAQMWCEAGAANVPMNIGQEVYDYVCVVDAREKDERAGNIGRFTRHYNVLKNEWNMGFAFGDWQNVRKALAGLNITPDDVETFFPRFSAKDAYIENLLAKNMGFVWIDPDNTIDLSKIGDNLDNLPDGEQYARVSTWNLLLDEDPESPTYGLFVLNMDSHSIYQPGYDPSEKRRVFTTTPTTPYDVGDLWLDGENVKRCTTARASGDYVPADWSATTLDAIADGENFRRVQSMALSPAGLVFLDQVSIGDTYNLVYASGISSHHILLSKTEKDGAWYEEQGVGIDANRGIGIYGGEGFMGLRTYPTLADYHDNINVQCYVGTDGKIYAGGGTTILDSLGLTLDGEALRFIEDSETLYGRIHIKTLGEIRALRIMSYNGAWVVISADSTLTLSGNPIIIMSDTEPLYDDQYSLGSPSKQFYGGYFASRLRIPCGVDMYD